jgi:replicative DNA helicase
MLYRDSYYDQAAENDDTVEIIVAKQRQGQSNRIVKARFNKDTQTYTDYTQGEAIEQEGMI